MWEMATPNLPRARSFLPPPCPPFPSGPKDFPAANQENNNKTSCLFYQLQNVSVLPPGEPMVPLIVLKIPFIQ